MFVRGLALHEMADPLIKYKNGGVGYRPLMMYTCYHTLYLCVPV